MDALFLIYEIQTVVCISDMKRRSKARPSPTNTGRTNATSTRAIRKVETLFFSVTDNGINEKL
jgi:hypothetical protein